MERDAAWAVLETVSEVVPWSLVRPLLLGLEERHRTGSHESDAPAYLRASVPSRYYKRVVADLDLLNPDDKAT